ncbi:hypothetical protein I302_101409 [Kwoniella bestiolae CBS 10118]|uniref:THO complex subunit 7 n=1 Tax=Kwoniella bestiolae CBS 10118 TaxID=1296100 RepID=A0A1B9GC55_9TREE|nr:hypothetical protein I302_00090 [Kwoniella bestiolae CBS 10118]OCF28602.1 hypothetical protein I302_00090 [Kwoniella bestiolae CBS 10118]
MSSAPFKEDALNRYRITHSDRDLKPLIRRLNRLPLLSKSTDLSKDDVELERELIRMELLKWRIGIERILGSIDNLDRQTECYKRQTRETVSKAEQLKLRLIQEKEELANKRKLREHQLKCDEIVKRIQGRGKSRKELDDQIESLTNSLREHTESHSLYLSTTQMRYEKFNEIIKLIDECRNLKLPVEPTSSLPTITNPSEEIADENRMDIDPSASSNPTSTSSKLNLSALEFQPSSSTSTSTNTNRQQSTVSAPNRSSAPPSGNGNLKPPSSGHMLPTRPNPSKPISGGVKLTRQNSNSNGLPSRPSNLRSSTTPAALHTGLGSGSLEDGEVGPEEGEVASSASTNGGEESRKRSRGSEASQTRNTRSRAK